MISSTNHFFIEEDLKQNPSFQDSTIAFYDKTVVFGSLPIDRERLYFNNISMIKDILGGWKEELKGTKNKFRNHLPLKFRLSKEDIDMIQKAKISSCFRSSLSYGDGSSRPLGFSENDLNYYIYNVYGFIGGANSSPPILLESVIFFYFITIFGYTLIGVLLAMAAARAVITALSGGLINCTGSAITCLRKCRVQYEIIKEKSFDGKSYRYSRIKLKKDPKDPTRLYSELQINHVPIKSFDSKFTDKTSISDHSRAFGVVNTSTYSLPRINGRSIELIKERIKAAEDLSKKKYEKITQFKNINNEKTALSEKEEENTIKTVHMDEKSIVYYGPLGTMTFNIDFGDYYFRRSTGRIKRHIKGKEYWKGQDNLKKIFRHGVLCYPKMEFILGGGTVAAVSNPGLLGSFINFDGWLSFDGKPISIYRSLVIDMEGPLVDIAAFLVSAGTVNGQCRSKGSDPSNSTLGLIYKKDSAFPSLKTKYLGFSLGKIGERGH